MTDHPMLAIVGSTGVVGREIINVLAERDHPGESITALATARSDGEEIDFDQETLPVEPVGPSSFRGVKAAVLAVPSAAAAALADEARKAGAWVVDVSGAWAADASVPLLVPGVNDRRLAEGIPGRVVSVAHPLSQALALALEPLRERGLQSVDATALVGAASWGHVGVRILEQQTASLLSGREPEPGPFPHRLAFNVVPQVGTFAGRGTTLEGLVRAQLGALWGSTGAQFGLTALGVSTFHGGLLTITARFAEQLTLEAVRSALQGSKALKLLDDDATGVYPMPMLVTGDPQVHVGRLRIEGNLLRLVVAVDLVGRVAETAATLALALARRD